MECEFCHKQFGVKGTLLRHQQTAKFCIKIQDEQKPKTNSKEFICTGCGKELSSKQRLQLHHNICEKYTENDRIRQLENELELQISITKQDKITIEELKYHIKELENKLYNIAIKSKGKTHNGNVVNMYNNFTAITPERLKQDAVGLTKDHLALGGPGVAQLALENSLKDNYKVTDVSRAHIQYVDERGKLILDPGSTRYTKNFCRSIVEPAKKIDKEVNLEEIKDNDEYERGVKIKTAVCQIKSAAHGAENELTKQFVKTIAKNDIRTLE